MNKQIAFYREKFTEARVDLLRVLAQIVRSGELSPQDALAKFVRITQMDPGAAQKYAIVMSEPEDVEIWVAA